ncbi:LysR family transcriptional regulator [Microbacterium aurum]
MNTSIDQLGVVTAVAEASSFSGAARRLHMTQPAVSRTVHLVETAVGALLFSRTTRTVELTADGIEFVAVASSIISEFDAGLGRFEALQRTSRGVLTVAALPVLASGLLAPIAAEFLSTRPDVELRLVTGSARNVLEMLRTGNADLAVTELPTDTSQISAVSLGVDPMCAVMRSDHELADRTVASWAELGDHRFIALSEGTSVRRLTDQGFAASGSTIQPVVTVDATMVAIEMISRGMGITAFPLSTRPVAGSRELMFIPIEEPRVFRELAVLTPRSPSPSSLTRAFSDQIIAAQNREDPGQSGA